MKETCLVKAPYGVNTNHRFKTVVKGKKYRCRKCGKINQAGEE